MKHLLLKSREGKEYDIGTMIYRIKLRGSDTGGLFSLLDFNVYPGAIGPGNHYNENYSKTFFILSGKLMLKIDNQETELAQGEVAYIPKKTLHDFANPYGNPCRFLLYISPAGLENFFEEAAASNPDEFLDLLKQYQIVMGEKS